MCNMSNETEQNAHSLSANQPDANALYAIAESQAGYFTTSQAAAAGYSRSLLSHHAAASTFLRVRRGIYRLARFPSSPWEDLYVAWLGCGPLAVVSHDSALAFLDLSDLLPSEVHVTVPRTSSRRRGRLRLHTSELRPDEITLRDGLPVTTAARTIADVANAGLAAELVDQAVDEAWGRGLTNEAALREQVDRRRGRAAQLLARALDRLTRY